MTRSSYLLWLGLALIILLPSTAGRFLVDLAGGLMLVALVLPLLLGGVGWIAWKILKNNLIICPTCGINMMKDSTSCPACGSSIGNNLNSENSSSGSYDSATASSATIDITAEEAD